MKKKFVFVLAFLVLTTSSVSVLLKKNNKEVIAGPFTSAPAWCTPGTPSASSTFCAGLNLILTDGAGFAQTRWAGQYLVRTSSTSWWLTYCLRDDMSHPVVTSDGTIMADLIDMDGNVVSLPPQYSYVLWKWGDTNDSTAAAAVWMLGHYYAQDTTDSGNIIVPNLSASNSSAVNSLAQSMYNEAETSYGDWVVSVAANAPTQWDGSTTGGTVNVKSATGDNLGGIILTLSATGGTVSPTTVTTDASGNASFNFTSSGGVVTVTASTNGPADYRILDPPGALDQYVGTSGGSQSFSANDSAEPRYAVGDYVWYDNNQNGIQDGGENPVDGVTVELRNNAGTTIGTTTTDLNGHYVFDDLAGGSYSVRFSDLPAEYMFTDQNSTGSTTANDSNPDITTGITSNFTLGVSETNMRDVVAGDGVTVAGMINPTIDAGIIPIVMDLAISKSILTAGPYSAGQSLVYSMVVTNNGPSDAAAGWSVTDLLPSGLTFGPIQPVAGSSSGFTCGTSSSITGGSSLTCTNSNGLASSSQSTLRLNVTIDSGATQGASYRNLAYVSPEANDIDETNPLVVPSFSTGNTSSTTTNNDSEATITIEQRYAVGDYVWSDVNHNGIQDAGEPAVADVTVELCDGTTNVLATTTTDQNGHYVFDNLAAGTYCVIFSDIPSGYVFTGQNSTGSTVASDSNPDTATGVTANFALGPSAPDMRPVQAGDGVTSASSINPTIDAGLYRPMIDLTITKRLVTASPFQRGQTVLYEIVGRNNGPDNAMVGWSITDLLPDGLTFAATQPHSDSESGFSCAAPVTVNGGASLKCINSEALANGAEKKLFLSVIIDEDAPQNSDMRNLVFIAPAANEIAETNPLQEPSFSTGSTANTATNNDSEAMLMLVVETAPNTGVKRIITSPLLITGAIMSAGVSLALQRLKKHS